jgi:tRNA G18 (ribose-2'-O)-methylase SpoU
MFYALVENVRSLYNVGAIFRTADGAGVSKIYLTGITGTPPHREIRKVALGAEESVAWEYVADSIELVKRLKREGVQVVVLESTKTSRPFDEVEYDFPLCLVIGHEFNGVSQEMLEQADRVVSIPMLGAKISLNVSVAFGVAVYEILKAKRNTVRQ